MPIDFKAVFKRDPNAMTQNDFDVINAVLEAGEVTCWTSPDGLRTRWYLAAGIGNYVAIVGNPMEVRYAVAAEHCVERFWLHKFNEYKSRGSNATNKMYKVTTEGKFEAQVYERKQKRARGELKE